MHVCIEACVAKHELWYLGSKCYKQKHTLVTIYQSTANRIGDVKLSVFASRALDLVFETRPCQTKDNWIGIRCFSAKYRPNNLSLVFLYLSLYISFLLFGHFFLFFYFIFFDTQKKKTVQIIKRKYIMTNIDTQETDYSVYAKYASFRSKRRNWLVWNQDNVPERNCGLLFRWVGTIISVLI